MIQSSRRTLIPPPSFVPSPLVSCRASTRGLQHSLPLSDQTWLPRREPKRTLRERGVLPDPQAGWWTWPVPRRALACSSSFKCTERLSRRLLSLWRYLLAFLPFWSHSPQKKSQELSSNHNFCVPLWPYMSLSPRGARAAGSALPGGNEAGRSPRFCRPSSKPVLLSLPLSPPASW